MAEFLTLFQRQRTIKVSFGVVKHFAPRCGAHGLDHTFTAQRRGAIRSQFGFEVGVDGTDVGCADGRHAEEAVAPGAEPSDAFVAMKETGKCADYARRNTQQFAGKVTPALNRPLRRRVKAVIIARREIRHPLEERRGAVIVAQEAIRVLNFGRGVQNAAFRAVSSAQEVVEAVVDAFNLLQVAGIKTLEVDGDEAVAGADEIALHAYGSNARAQASREKRA